MHHTEQAASPSDAALRRQLERHVGVQQARLLALVTGQPETTRPPPATPAASPLPAPEGGAERQRSADSGRCHALYRSLCLEMHVLLPTRETAFGQLCGTYTA